MCLQKDVCGFVLYAIVASCASLAPVSILLDLMFSLSLNGMLFHFRCSCTRSERPSISQFTGRSTLQELSVIPKRYTSVPDAEAVRSSSHHKRRGLGNSRHSLKEMLGLMVAFAKHRNSGTSGG